MVAAAAILRMDIMSVGALLLGMLLAYLLLEVGVPPVRRDCCFFSDLGIVVQVWLKVVDHASEQAK